MIIQGFQLQEKFLKFNLWFLSRVDETLKGNSSRFHVRFKHFIIPTYFFDVSKNGPSHYDDPPVIPQMLPPGCFCLQLSILLAALVSCQTCSHLQEGIEYGVVDRVDLCQGWRLMELEPWALKDTLGSFIQPPCLGT